MRHWAVRSTAGPRTEQAPEVAQVPGPGGFLRLLERLSGSREGLRCLGQPRLERSERWLKALADWICFGRRLH
jgi:hypothetical protein